METLIYILQEAQLLQWEAGKETMQWMAAYPTLLAASELVEVAHARQVCPLPYGTMIYLRPGDGVTVRHKGNKGMQTPHVYKVEFDCYRLAERSDDSLLYRRDRESLPESGWRTGNLPYLVYPLLREMTELPLPEMSGESGRSRILLERLLRLAFDGSGSRQEEMKEASIYEALSYIHEHYDRPITCSSVAQTIGFNRSYFSTLFRRSTGWGFSEYVNRIRIEKAKEHLLTSDMTLQQIATKVGYASGLYLSRKFKQAIGISPGEFRNRPKPRRIAAFQFAGLLLALGIMPVAADAQLLLYSRPLRRELSDVPAVVHPHGLEQLQALDVDLILVPSYYYNVPDKLKRLETIAPVVAMDWGEMDSLEEARFMGKLLGMEREAEQWITRYLDKVRLAKRRLEKHVKPGETAALYEIREDRIGIWNRTVRGAYNLYDMLKLPPPDKVLREVLIPGKHKFITESQLPDYAADHMFVVFCEGGDCESNLNQLLRESPIWSSLPAARRNRIYPLDLEECWCSDGLLLERQLAIQMDWFTGNMAANI
ncbi:AraC family transcriptional regulator [Paenibacillus thiaminolyticus]|uniref:AraC family transcriptional regulator n=1 Tax=Paenibacillus thiaminolyticus TaxID=49283 RepID=UPI003D2D9E94